MELFLISCKFQISVKAANHRQHKEYIKERSHHPAFLPFPCQAPIGIKSRESHNPST